MARPRLQDVADQAGVSLATASRVLNGSSRQPGPGLVEKVRAAAADLGYVVNAQAQALARSRTGLLGLVVQDISDPYFSTIAAGAQDAARASGHLVLLASTGRDPVAEREAVAAFAAHRVDAVVVAGTRWAPEDDDALAAELDRFVVAGGRSVVVGQPVGEGYVVRPPNAAGATALAEALLAQGHRRFAVLGGPATVVTSRERAEAFVGAVRAGGGVVTDVLETEFSRDGGYAAGGAVADLVAGASDGTDPLCVFAVTDVMAIGAIARLRELGVEVPRDVSLAGFDDVPTLRDHVPGLTTVRIPLEEMGRLAVRAAVVETVTAPGASPHGGVTEVEFDVVLRASTARS
ncbi:LacI family transcriptional regulator [Isoptericola sp. NEAU-Y5]|uniref:LacI family transcriptional regulator n=1 Tax=Isoptericola luteus TaxID=2879484 RepID=A0ABS7ZDD7_9MICO|nr:LacI family DNA-binding transcriptional regulator [Isoptericola sp. NEAU-Y5]MCA5892281.1 LacI family transcriptional regulator [Isoptericola sp. NEAU-Y5]